MADTSYTNATATTPGTVVVAPWLNDVNTNTYTILNTVAGTNAITAVGASTVTVGYPRGVAFRFLPVNTNTGAVTINISGLGIKNVTKYGTTPLVANDLLVGSWAYITYDGTQFQLINPATVSVSTVSGVLPVVNGGNGISTIIPARQCLLTKSGANIVLSPFGGNVVTFPAGHATVPAAGVSLAPTGLTPGTLYYIYGVQTAGVVTSLEASTTVPVADATTGIRIKTGDATRRLQGMVRPITGPAFEDTAAHRFVISWDNPRPISLSAFFTAVRTVGGGGAFAEINVEIRNEFLSWATNAVSSGSTGYFFNSIANPQFTTLGLDGVAQDCGTGGNVGAGLATPYAITWNTPVTEGYHYITLMGRTTGGVGSWNGSVTSGDRCTVTTMIQG